jgi:hypothetical protein
MGYSYRWPLNFIVWRTEALEMPYRAFMNRYWRPIGITVLSIAVLFRGWRVSDPTGVPVTRAGALVTTFGLLFAFWQYGRLLADREHFVANLMRRQLLAMGFREDAEPAQLIQGKVQSVTRRRERIIASWEGIIIMIGTLTWGFGDLIYQYWQKHLTILEMFWKLWRLGA